MGSIQGNVGKERLVFLCGTFDEVVGLLEEDVGAEAFRFFDLTIVEIGSVKIRVVPDIGSLANASAAMTVDFFKTPVFGTIGIVVSEVPLTEHGGGVVFLEMLAESDFVLTDHGASHDGVPDAGAVGPVAA